MRFFDFFLLYEPSGGNQVDGLPPALSSPAAGFWAGRRCQKFELASKKFVECDILWPFVWEFGYPRLCRSIKDSHIQQESSRFILCWEFSWFQTPSSYVSKLRFSWKWYLSQPKCPGGFREHHGKSSVTSWLREIEILAKQWKILHFSGIFENSPKSWSIEVLEWQEHPW